MRGTLLETSAMGGVPAPAAARPSIRRKKLVASSQSTVHSTESVVGGGAFAGRNLHPGRRAARSGQPVPKGGNLAGWLWRDLLRNQARVTPCRGGLGSLLLGLFRFALSFVFVSHAKRLPQLANHSQQYPPQ